MINAVKFGAPPHGGSAPGVDRIVMLLADEPNIREVVVFPMNQKAEDLMMNASAPVSDKQLKELGIRIVDGPRRQGVNETREHRLETPEGDICWFEWGAPGHGRSDEHTSELQSLKRTSYAVFCLKKKDADHTTDEQTQ